MFLSIGQKIAAGFVVALATLLIIGTSSFQSQAQLSDLNKWVGHSYEVKTKLEQMRADLMQAESAARGFRLSRDAALLNSFEKAKTKLLSDLASVIQLTQDRTSQQVRLGLLKPLVEEQIKTWQAGADTRYRPVNLSPGSPVEEGKATLTRIGQIMDALQLEEESLLSIREADAVRAGRNTRDTILYGTSLAFVGIGLVAFFITRGIVNALQILSEGAQRLGTGDYTHRVRVKARDEIGVLAAVFNQMAGQIESRVEAQTREDWLKTGLARCTAIFQAQRSAPDLGQALLAELATTLGAQPSLFYVVESEKADRPVRLRVAAAYAAEPTPAEVSMGEGLVGQAYREQRRLTAAQVPGDYLKVRSGLGDAPPGTILVQPALDQGQVNAVLELAFLHPPTAVQVTLLEQIAESLGIVMSSIAAEEKTRRLLEKAQALSLTLQRQRTELAQKNEALETQAGALRRSEEQLQHQQEELRQTNEELEQSNEEMQQTNEEMEEKVELLAEQKKEMERINDEIELARRALEEKARQLAASSKYKSDFLSNMSHELRTPLNSLLILSRMLSENGERNLTDKQVRYAETIYNSGNDLLALINEILDLSKIESGTVQLEIAVLEVASLPPLLEATFRPLAETRQLEFVLALDKDLPGSLRTDERRLLQILKNLLANAFKFTDRGSVRLEIGLARAGWDPEVASLNRAEKVVAFSVVDTGIGVPLAKQQIIFEAFQQGESGVARKYGGTGLGLAISRQLARRLGGSLELQESGPSGSRFILYLPTRLEDEAATPPEPVAPSLEHSGPIAPAWPSLEADAEIADDRANLEPGNRLLLIIDDDVNFARILVDFAREKKFKAVVARSVEQGVALARRLRPAAITLDLQLPDSEGWLVLDRLKHDPQTRHIPIHIISVDEERERSLRLGAVSFLQKPVTKEAIDATLSQTIEFIDRSVKKLLIIEDDPMQRECLIDLIGRDDIAITGVGSAVEAFAALEREKFDCLVLDLGLPDLSGVELVQKIREQQGPQAPPLIVYTGKDLSRREETELRLLSDSIVVKSVRSPERLLDETALFLHRVQARLPDAKQRMLEEVQKKDSLLRDRHVLVVDDDVRNIFALTSALEASQMRVSYAESGTAALEFLTAHPETEVVLMDVMMPEMDGFEAIRRIRQMPAFARLPIISVTAKAMKGDREKCLEVGASDYITKPVDLDQLRSLLRVWLYR